MKQLWVLYSNVIFRKIFNVRMHQSCDQRTVKAFPSGRSPDGKASFGRFALSKTWAYVVCIILSQGSGARASHYSELPILNASSSVNRYPDCFKRFEWSEEVCTVLVKIFERNVKYVRTAPYGFSYPINAEAEVVNFWY